MQQHMYYNLDTATTEYTYQRISKVNAIISNSSNLHRKQVHVSSVPRHCVHQYINNNWRRDRNSIYTAVLYCTESMNELKPTKSVHSNSSLNKLPLKLFDSNQISNGQFNIKVKN